MEFFIKNYVIILAFFETIWLKYQCLPKILFWVLVFSFSFWFQLMQRIDHITLLLYIHCYFLQFLHLLISFFKKIFSVMCSDHYFRLYYNNKSSKIVTSLCVVIRVLLNPGQDLRHSCIHTIIILSGTSIAPGHNSNYCCLFSSFVVKC